VKHYSPGEIINDNCLHANDLQLAFGIYCQVAENVEPRNSLTPRTRAAISVGRRGTNQLRLLERYLDILIKHTTEIPPPTALVEETAPSALVEDVSLG
jgi:hypothetical protein